MEVKLELIATTEKLIPQLNQVKGATNALGESATKAGASYTNAFKNVEIGSLKIDKSVAKNVQSYAMLESAINDTIVNGIAKFVAAQEKANEKMKKLPKEGEENFKSFKTRIREATAEVSILQQKFNAGLIPIEQLNTAKQGLANLKEEFGDFTAEIDSLNPEKKFTAVAQLASGAAGGIAAAQGAMALFGTESEEVNKALLKVNAALALSQGLNQVMGMADAWENFKGILGLTTAAEVVDTTVTTGLTTATTFATVATQAWGVAMKLLPIFAIIAGVTALVGLIGELGSETENLKREMDAVNSSSERFTKTIEKQRNASKDRQEGIKSEIELAKKQGKSEAEIGALRDRLAAEALRSFQSEVDANTERINNLLALQTKLEAALKKDPSKENFDNVTANEDRIQALRDANKEIIKEGKAFGRELKKDEQQDADDRIANQKQLNDTLLQSNEAYHDAVLQLEAKVLSSQGEQAIGVEKLRIQKVQSEKELEAFKAALIEKGQEQENAEAAAEGRKARTFQLSQQQLEQFHTLDMLLLKKFNDDVAKLAEEKQQTELDFVRDTNEKALKQFEIDFAKRKKKYIEQGISESKIAEQKDYELLLLNTKLANDNLTLEEKNAIDLINTKERGKETELQFETQKQLDILQIQKDFALKRQALNLQALAGGDASKERLAAITSLDAMIADLTSLITKKQTELTNKPSKLSLARLLGITGINGQALTAEEEAQFNQAAEAIVGSVFSIFQEALAQQQTLNDEAIQQNQDYISSIENRISATEDALNRELEAQKKGYANNVDAKKKELAELNNEKIKAIEEDKKLQKERKRIAQEQAIIDAIVQSSQLLTAGATLFAKGAFSGGAVGVITAIATIAAMIASFVALKSKIAQATKFEEGGTIGGRRHAQGGHKYVSQDGSGRVIELEDGEEVTNRKASQRHRSLLKAIGSGQLDHFQDNEILSLLSGTGVYMKDGTEKNVANESIQLQRAEVTHKLNMRLSGVEERLDSLNEEVSGVHKHLLSLPQVVTKPDGSQQMTEKKGNVEIVTIIRK